MNLILLLEEDFVTTGNVRLGGRRLQHIREVHRATVGDDLKVGLLDGQLGSGRITELSNDIVELEVHLDRPPPDPLRLTLLIALPRPKVLRRVLQTVASMGVKRIVLMKTWRVDKSYWDSPVLTPDGLRQELILGLEQGCDTVLPEVTIEKRFKPFVEDRLPALAAETRKLVAHPGGGEFCPTDVAGPITVAVGPEGGFLPYEVELLQQCGFRSIHLGQRILRVEAAVPALISRLKLGE